MRHLLIDAYNVICATDSLREIMQGKLDTARDQLAEIVRSIHDAESVHVALVLESRNEKLEAEHPSKVKTFQYLYVPAATSADGVIESMVSRVTHTPDTTDVSNDIMANDQQTDG